MGKFLEAEKQRYVDFKLNTAYLTDEARKEGLYKGKARPFCLPQDNADQNLFQGIRESAIAYFDEFEIKWHDGRNKRPSNHLCDSQVCCMNFLFSFAAYPEALAGLLRPLFPQISKMLAMEGPGQYVSIEWIGLENYLKEKVRGKSKRTRGANFTSADAAVMFERQDGLRQIVLIEWKYTESYSRTFLRFSKSGTDRTEIYRHLFERKDFPLDKDKLPDFSSLFYEPFYQFLRQQLLAYEMEKARELGADRVSLLHIAPTHNKEFQRITSPDLVELGGSVIEVWKSLLLKKDRFQSTAVESLFGQFLVKQYPEMADWWEYTHARYPWFNENSGDILV